MWKDINSEIWYELKRNCLGFIFIGVAVGLLSYFSEGIHRNPVVAFTLDITGSNFNIKDFVFDIFTEQMTPKTLASLLLLVCIISLFHRVIVNKLSRIASWFAQRVIMPINRFAVSYSVAMVGCLLGIALTSLLESLTYFVAFLFFVLFPLAALYLLKMFSFFIGQSPKD